MVSDFSLSSNRGNPNKPLTSHPQKSLASSNNPLTQSSPKWIRQFVIIS